MWWIIGAVLVVMLLLDIWHDPRKLRIGVFLVFLITWLALTFVDLISEVNAGSDRELVWAVLTFIGLGLSSVLFLGLFNIANGMTMMRRERRSLANMLSLIFGVIQVGLVAYIVTVMALESVSPSAAFEMFRWLLFAAFPIAYMAFVFLAFWLQSLLYSWVSPQVGRKADAVIVLGAGLRDGNVTPLLAARLDRGKRAFERLRKPDSVLIVSGGQGSDEPHPESKAMADYLLERGVDAARLWQEDQSRTTRENLTLSAELLEDRGRTNPLCVVVTNNYHVFRAALLMRKLGLGGHAVGAPTARYYWPSAFLREYVAILRDHKILTAIALALTTMPLIFMLIIQVLNLFR